MLTKRIVWLQYDQLRQLNHNPTLKKELITLTVTEVWYPQNWEPDVPLKSYSVEVRNADEQSAKPVTLKKVSLSVRVFTLLDFILLYYIKTCLYFDCSHTII